MGLPDLEMSLEVQELIQERQLGLDHQSETREESSDVEVQQKALRN